jgi:2-furoyl-CoA dehydrogenase large subunit
VSLDVRIRGTPEGVWAFLWDADALGRVLPGCESILAEGPGTYRLVLAMRTALLTVRADATATLHDPDPPRTVRLTLDGTPRGLGGAFHVEIPITLLEEGVPEDAQTRIEYDVDVRVTGSMAAFGQGILRDAIVREVQGLAADIEREIAAGRAATDADRREAGADRAEVPAQGAETGATAPAEGGQP